MAETPETLKPRKATIYDKVRNGNCSNMSFDLYVCANLLSFNSETLYFTFPKNLNTKLRSADNVTSTD
jgi:hypothetical protein